mmetsp:Transcript_41708/g.75100  ORF Transcript_41708/g.75100 Transcript_41708/m.75100 type:complete len:351 (-) Transcript_41708:333-1385(-)|eukprot:CAMPEP_0201869642 /NCGR_PEP_ID=MMETSP0902-20130614/3088_1 /ASSEMBLY_ACC=CAM_ASM_000551 /TAXON_ID=420261 /ORGANISM="Thalassiosira antarctica, Strain CCMP982" /LENGTH=350 /DNA_ID=CAMNT_0048395187 /DNA_START=29 /DNA_END=1084 /DNA_ORIENTATION=-
MPSLLSNLKSAREWVTPTLKSSAFLTRGVLTPEEFVDAGDELVFKCPTWTWEAGDPSKRKKHLPADKQYLMTRNVPCTARVSSLENVVAVSNREAGGGGDDDDDDGDWLVSHILTAEEQRKREEKALEEEFDILDGEGEVVEKLGQVSISGEQGKSSEKKDAAGATAAADGEDDDEYADMADFEDDDVMADEAAVTAAPSVPSTTDAANENENILKVRSYDISITYDKYYQTPRVWLMGYADDGSNRPLTGDEMMQDVISDYAHRTVTVENHPHVSGPHASIHPCQHGAVMKTIVKNLTRDSSEKEEDGSGGSDGPSVDMYIFIFLKFVSSMIPTINYDFTMDVSASTKK